MQAERELSVEETVALICPDVAAPGTLPPEPGRLLSDLGLDSLGCADLAVAVEEHFGVRLADADVDPLSTVGDVARAVQMLPGLRPRIPKVLGRAQNGAKAVAGWAFGWQARLKVRGAHNIPSDGPVILAANHRSMLDIPLVVVACPRPVYFMAKATLFRGWFLAWLFHELGAFRVSRGGPDLRALDTALAVLDTGNVLGIYPEGTRSRTGEMLPFLKGAAWLALRTGAPLVPCGIVGTARWRNVDWSQRLRKQVAVAFGPPIVVEREDDAALRRTKAERLTADLMQSVAELAA